jgi:hypothetical protein
MATLASSFFVSPASPANRFADRLPQQRRPFGRRAMAEVTPTPLSLIPEEASLRTTLPVFALGLLALLATALWPMLFVAVIVVLAVLAPVVAIILGVVADVKRNRVTE